MTPHEFIRKWRPVALTERQTAQEHFIDLCRLVGHPTPVELDPTGESYCFKKGSLKSSGTPGFADVWKRGFFAFEYKKKKRNLSEALKQLSQYAWNLENPPLNVVCDTNTIRIVTVWTNTPSRTFDLTLDDLADPEKFAVLHAVFHDPEKLKQHRTREMLTREAADTFSGLALRFQSRGHAPEKVAHFIMQLVFCFFAEDVKLLPDGFFRKAIFELNQRRRWEKAKAMFDDIFSAMATGERFGLTPNVPAAIYAADPRAMRIAAAAKRLDDLRNAWLNPPDLVRIEPEVVPGYPDRILPKDEGAAAILAKRTLTNLYNQRPQWLADAHDAIDRAVAAAYGWPEDIEIEDAMERLLVLNLARVARQGGARD